MIELANIAPGFVPHPALVETLSRGFRLPLRANGKEYDLLRDGALWLDTHTPERKVWRGHLWLPGGAWVKTVLEARSGKPVVRGWTVAGYGSSAEPAPTFESQDIEMGGLAGPVIDTQGARPLHGQGCPMQAWSYDFGKREKPWTYWATPNTPTRYVPRDATQTGGDWPYMGIRFGGEINPRELYPFFGYPGWMLVDSPRGIGLVSVSDLVLHDGTHYHPDAKDPGYIRYTKPSEPYQDRAREPFRYPPDDQHFSILGAVAQTYLRTKDEGLRLMLEMAVGRCRLQFPADDRGTSHHIPGAARAQGRVIKDCAEIAWALRECSPNAAARMWEHTKALYRNQLVAWRDARQAGKPTQAWFEGPHFSPAEEGIRFWGLYVYESVADAIEDEAATNAIDAYKADIARFCFDSFRIYDGYGWSVPYRIHEDGTLSPGPSGGAHFAWLAAVNHEPTTDVDKAKHRALVKFGETLDARWKG